MGRKGERMAEIQNAKITNAELTMEDHGVLCYWITVEGAGWGVGIGGYVIGKGYLGAKAFSGSPKGTEAIMRIMDTVGVDKWSDLKGKYVRVVTEGWGETVSKFGHITDNKWFDQREFFATE